MKQYTKLDEDTSEFKGFDSVLYWSASFGDIKLTEPVECMVVNRHHLFQRFKMLVFLLFNFPGAAIEKRWVHELSI